MVGSIYHAFKKLEQEGHIALARVERTGHLPFVERPGAFCAALLQALHSL